MNLNCGISGIQAQSPNGNHQRGEGDGEGEGGGEGRGRPAKNVKKRGQDVHSLSFPF